MAITIEKELYMSMFPHIAIVKIDNIWRICRGQFVNKDSDRYDLFVTPYMGQTLKATYPDFRLYDFSNAEEQLYQVVCDYNVSELSQKKKVIAAPAQTARPTLAQVVAAEDQIRRRVVAVADRAAEITAEAQRQIEEINRNREQRLRNNVYYTTTNDPLDDWAGYGYGATYNT